MKKILISIVTLIAFLAVGCQSPVGIVEEGSEVRDNIRAKVVELLDEEVKAVNELNLDKYIEKIDPSEQELIVEQTNWFNDLILEPIDAFSLELLAIDQIDDSSFKAQVQQVYKRGNKDYKIVLDKKIVYNADKMFDSGSYFAEISNDSFIIKYTDVNNEVAERLINQLQPIYDEFADRWKIRPERKVIIKLFDDKEILRQSIKLSMWQCAGWYEFGESVRMYIDSNKADIERLKGVVRHELVHMFTMTKANGNVAYWLAEGLAMNYQDVSNPARYKELMQANKNLIIGIDKLEGMELEKLEDNSDIRKYYFNSQLIVSFIIDIYGEQALQSLLTELGEKERQRGTGHENDKIYKEYLHEILPAVLGLKDYKEFISLWQKETGQMN